MHMYTHLSHTLIKFCFFFQSFRINSYIFLKVEDDSFNLSQVISMFVVDIFLYAILAWYIEAVHPGTYGIPRPWYFPFQLSYWLGPNVKLNSFGLFNSYKRIHSAQGESPNTPALLAMEEEPSHLKLGVVIDSLFKVFFVFYIEYNFQYLTFFLLKTIK